MSGSEVEDLISQLGDGVFLVGGLFEQFVDGDPCQALGDVVCEAFLAEGLGNRECQAGGRRRFRGGDPILHLGVDFDLHLVKSPLSPCSFARYCSWALRRADREWHRRGTGGFTGGSMGDV